MTSGWIVGIGGSSGSLQPLRRILSCLPEQFDAPVLVTIHRHTSSKDILAKLLNADPGLRARQAEDGIVPAPSTAYIAPPGLHLLVYEGRLRLSGGPRENRSRPSIDVMLRSMAVDCGTRAIGVVLSGLLNDGADGLKSIGECGGRTIVQDPADAEFDEMPDKAQKARQPDRVLRVDDIASALVDLTNTAPSVQAEDCPPAHAIERDIALGRRLTMGTEHELGTTSNVTCPDCGGVLWYTSDKEPIKLRCHTGHAFTADVLASAQVEKVEESLWIAMRSLRERAEILRKLSERAANAKEREDWGAKARETDQRADELGRTITLLGKIPSL